VPPRKKQPTAVVREPKKPVPPRTITGASLDEHDFAPESSYERLAFLDLDLSGRKAGGMRFAQCRFRGATLSGGELDHLDLRDCLVQHSDWANVHAERGTLTRVTVDDSRMTGFALSNGMVRDTAFTDCRVDLSNWRFTDFEAVRFSGCNLTGADFTHADLSGARFVGCDLTGAQFHQATMEGTRFKGCTLIDIDGVTSFRGASVHEGDLLALSYTLAGALGIRIDSDG
jgi:uncharacterized protein YjbI with pentapeptide repeats